jgi:hypothetical protein
MKGPCWRIYIALFLFIILIVAFRYTEGFDSYNKFTDNTSSEYATIDSSYNTLYQSSSQLNQDASH